ncbi:Gfo/Idh/MocA family oxidoreductase [candidate division KSB1 bacterium]|nr:Gfo/Idh/MocA family oxidoreductase [candidate division KSB1 bacterium]RQW03710.1 MAG: gfo/Idh/MocA family oxidoreductase [candidate division KSB1 bacterium]
MTRQSLNFALIGAAGYIAPRHMQAIKETSNRLVCALDPSDSVGILDRYFDDVDFFTDFERFDRHIGLLRRVQHQDMVDYVSICSPNFLHDAHIRFALRNHADAICEKPLVLNPWNLDALEEDERETGHRVYNVLQLRIHPTIQELKRRMAAEDGKRHVVDLSYITRRGKWYRYSWKGDVHKSGGVATNIGIHFFDMLMWIFGKAEKSQVHIADDKRMAGYLELQKADVRWFLSVDCADLPETARSAGRPTYRCIFIDGQEIEFSEGFADLHTLVYQDILAGRGYGIADARPSIELAYALRGVAAAVGDRDRVHPMAWALLGSAVSRTNAAGLKNLLAHS